MQQNVYQATVLLHHYLEQCGRDHAEVAAAVGTTPAVLNGIVRGTTLADEPLARALAQAVSSPFAALFVRYKPRPSFKQMLKYVLLGAAFTAVALVIIGLFLYLLLRSDPTFLVRSLSGNTPAQSAPMYSRPKVVFTPPVLQRHTSAKPRDARPVVMPSP